jgi:hypothetical protein
MELPVTLRAGSLRRLPLLWLLLAGAAACHGQTSGRAETSDQPRTEFARLIEHLSEPGGYFDTDNLISNEASYLHVMGAMRDRDITGGAYLGVGPGQNFSYIAQIRPRIAFIVDIRRDNMLQHLLYKALFELSDTRLAFLTMLTGRPLPQASEGWLDRGIHELVALVDTVPASGNAVRAYRRSIEDRIAAFGVPLDEEDLATIRRFHDTFIDAGLGLRFNSFGRAPQPYYPTLRQLLLETDLTGRQANYLAEEAGFQFVKQLQQRDLVIPVVGDLAGDHAVRAIGDYLKSIDQRVTAFYTSNVEFYVMRDRRFGRLAANLVGLPLSDRGVIIRSFFGGMFRSRHPQAVPGYYSTQLLQAMKSFAQEYEAGGWSDYLALVTDHSLPLR